MTQEPTVTRRGASVHSQNEQQVPNQKPKISAIRWTPSIHDAAMEIRRGRLTFGRLANEGLELRVALNDGIPALVSLAKEMVKR